MVVGWSRMSQSRRVLELRPRVKKPNMGRPLAHWTDDMHKFSGRGCLNEDCRKLKCLVRV